MTMRYIRVEENVYELCEKQKYDNQWQVKVNGCLIGYRLVYKDRVIKSADTIEELCDEFIAYHKTLKLTYCIKKTPFEKQDENFNFYGAIWTEWGLRYVAKMNDKGELELL